MVMQKVYLFPENLGESKNLNIGFMFVLILLIDIYWHLYNISSSNKTEYICVNKMFYDCYFHSLMIRSYLLTIIILRFFIIFINITYFSFVACSSASFMMIIFKAYFSFLSWVYLLHPEHIYQVHEMLALWFFTPLFINWVSCISWSSSYALQPCFWCSCCKFCN